MTKRRRTDNNDQKKTNRQHYGQKMDRQHNGQKKSDRRPNNDLQNTT
jgi:hypothetical protein